MPLRAGTREPTVDWMAALPVSAILAAERARFVRIARRRPPTEADAEDVVQQAMARAIQRAGSLEDPARLESWFAQILRHAIADFYRLRRPEGASQDAALQVAVEEPDAAGNACQCSLHLLGALRPAYGEVLRRVDVEGQAPEAVAAALAISEAQPGAPVRYGPIVRARRPSRRVCLRRSRESVS
jgi:RNA polymerase sigma factor (sigma-70 family)